jgi:pyruvate/2-oxoglutarate dehydrogenase complex dihydrolipoamide acyltransferase (E2) component
MFSKNVNLGPASRLSPWRKIAIGTWKTTGDPSVYGILELEVENALEYLEKIRTTTGQKLTLTHFVGKACAQMIEKHPEINSILRFGKIYPRKSIDIFFQVASDDQGKDLTGMTIRQANEKSLIQISQEMTTQVEIIRKKDDPAYRKSKNTISKFPGLLLYPVIKLMGFIMYGLIIWTPALGLPKDPFGSIMVTSIGSLGLDFAFAPLVPYSHIPMILAVGAAKETPVVRNGKVVPAMTCRLCTTFDHRLIDGMHAKNMVKTLQRIFADPEGELGKVTATGGSITQSGSSARPLPEAPSPQL